MEHHIGNVGCARLNQLFPHGEGNQRSVLAEDKQVEGVALGGGGLYQILVAQGEGIGVHDQGGGNAVLLCLCQSVQEAGEAVPTVFHEDQLPVYPGNFVKAKAFKEFGGACFGVQEQVGVAPAELHLHQVGDDLIEQPLALVVRADGEAPQGRAEAAAGGDDGIIFIPHGADIVQIAVPGDALLLQQSVNLGKAPPVRRVNLGNKILTHCLSPSENAENRSGPADLPCPRGRDFFG